MAAMGSVLLCTLLWLVLALNVGAASDGASSPFTCLQVRELFEGDFGSPDALHTQPELEKESSLCRHGSTGSHYSCCSEDTERKFADTVERRLKEDIRKQNHGLKKHIKNLLARYQDRIDKLTEEAQNRTCMFLSRLHKIPWAEHQPVVSSLIRGLRNGVATGFLDRGLDDVFRDFFKNLFPAVFNYVLSSQGEQRSPISAEYHSCLKRYSDQIQPFGNQPELLLRQLRKSMKHTVAFEDAMRTFANTITSTEAVSLDSSCRQALVRLQVCPGCRGLSLKGSPVKPCRGMCLNVVRGCLAKMSEISSSWDDLVVAFENLQVGMLGHHDLQKTLIYLDMNVSEAIMMAMGDSARIYAEVRVKCQHHLLNDHQQGTPLPLIPAHINPDEGVPSARSTSVMFTFRKEMKNLVQYLEDSKGIFNRLPDSLCQNDLLFSQDMLSESCWNGTAIGRYMKQVPEANFLSQVQHNKEVKVTLMDPDFKFLQVKESLTHMRRNLSLLLNREIMVGDDPHKVPFKTIGVEGSGYTFHSDVIIDDEDLIAYGSGSGSGSGDDGDDEDDSKPTDGMSLRPPHTTEPTDSAHRTAASSLLVLTLCMGLHRLVDRFL